MTGNESIVAGQMFDAVSVLVQAQTTLSDSTMARLSAFYPAFVPGVGYTTGGAWRWGANADGKPLLFAVSKPIKSGDMANPDTVPGSFRLIG